MPIGQPGSFGPLGAWTRRDLRASDADREFTVDALRHHAGDGRLTVDEMSERIDRVYAARTLGELDVLVHDLPTARPSARAGAISPIVIPGFVVAAGRRRRSLVWFGLRLAIIDLALLAIWFATGAHVGSGFWPIWPIILSALWLALRAVKAAERRRIAASRAGGPQAAGWDRALGYAVRASRRSRRR